MTDHHDEMRVSPDPSQAEDLRQRLHARMARGSQDVHDPTDVDPARLVDEHGDAVDRAEVIHRRPVHRGRTLTVVLAAAAVLALVVGAVALLRIDRRDAAPVTTEPTTTTTIPGGDQRLDPETVYLDVQEHDGEVTGQFRVNDVVVTVQCSDTDNPISGEIRLVGEVTANPDGRRLATLHDGTAAEPPSDARERLRDGDLVALVIREVAILYTNDGAGSCTDLLEVVPNLDGGFFDTIAGSIYSVEIRGEDPFNP